MKMDPAILALKQSHSQTKALLREAVASLSGETVINMLDDLQREFLAETENMGEKLHAHCAFVGATEAVLSVLDE